MHLIGVKFWEILKVDSILSDSEHKDKEINGVLVLNEMDTKSKISWVIYIQLDQQEGRKFLKGPFRTLSQSKIDVLGHGVSYQIPLP